MSGPRAAGSIFYGKDAISMRDKLIVFLKREEYPAECISKVEQAFPLWYEKDQAVWSEPSYMQVIQVMGEEPYYDEVDGGPLVFGFRDAVLQRYRLIECLRRSGVPEDDVQSISRKYPVIDGKWRFPEYGGLVAASGRIDYYPDISNALLGYEYPDDFPQFAAKEVR